MSDLISRCELFNRLATITAEDPNEMKAKIYAVIQEMETEQKERPEKFLPCICGCNRRAHYYQWIEGGTRVRLECLKCGRDVSGMSEAEAKRNWNKMIRAGQTDCSWR